MLSVVTVYNATLVLIVYRSKTYYRQFLSKGLEEEISEKVKNPLEIVGAYILNTMIKAVV